MPGHYVGGPDTHKMDLQRTYVRGALEVCEAAIEGIAYTIEDDFYRETIVRLTDLLAQTKRVKEGCDTEFMEHTR